MNKKLLKQLAFSVYIAVAVLGIFIPFFGNSKAKYRLEKFDLSKISGINTNNWTRSFITSPFPYLVLRNINTNIKKYVLSSADCNIVNHGYKNNIELFVILSEQGKVENVILGKNIETPSLIRKMRLNGFLQQWNGKNKIKKVQYVTGATYSSKAVSKSVLTLLDLVKHKLYFEEK